MPMLKLAVPATSGPLSLRVRTLVVILLAALAGCKAAARPVAGAAGTDEPPSAPCAPCPQTLATTLDAGWIDVRVTLPAVGTGPFPVVLSPILPDEELLARGIAVARFHTNWQALRGLAALTPEPSPSPAAPATAPQPQVGAWLLAAPRPGIVGRAYFDIISMDAERTVPRSIDYLETLPQIDASRIAITGSSTGGFIALQAMAQEPRIAVGAVRVACGDYHTFLRSSSLALADDPRWLPNGELVLDPDYAVEIAAREPIRHASRFPPRPLLLLAGEKDAAIPYECVENTVVRFEAAYAARGVPDRFRFVPFADQGHNLAGADVEVLAWLERWLSP